MDRRTDRKRQTDTPCLQRYNCWHPPDGCSAAISGKVQTHWWMRWVPALHEYYIREREDCGLVYIPHCLTSHVIRLTKQCEFISYLLTFAKLSFCILHCWLINPRVVLRVKNDPPLCLRAHIFLTRPLGAKVEKLHKMFVQNKQRLFY